MDNAARQTPSPSAPARRTSLWRRLAPLLATRRRRAGHSPDPAPQSARTGLDSTARRDTARLDTARVDTARVVQSLATSRINGFLDHEYWPEIARLLLNLGCNWPAATDLAAMAASSSSAIDEAVERLAEQTGREAAGLPALEFWDTVCGLLARAWRLEVFDEVTAMYTMDTLWWDIRDFDRSTSSGLQIIWRGMGFKEMHDHFDVREEATALLIEADRLIPADAAVNGALCETVLEAVRDSFYC